MGIEKTNREILVRFVRENFNIRSGEIPGDILRRLRVKGDPDLDDLTKPRFQPIHDLMADMIALYEKRLNVKIRILGMDEYVRLSCRAKYACRLCGFMEYLFDAENRTVYIERYEYDIRVLIFLYYADAVLRSRGWFRRPVSNIRLFCIHAYPPLSVFALNRLHRFGNPFLGSGDRCAMYLPETLEKARYWFNKNIIMKRTKWFELV